MEPDINIQQLVDRITIPDAVCHIENDVPDNPEDLYLHIIYSLLNVIKASLHNELFTPYIHIKDINGNLIFNDQLHIQDNDLNTFFLNGSGCYDIHLIRENDSKTIFYCAKTPRFLEDDNPFYLNRINFSGGDVDRSAYEKAVGFIINMIRKKELIPRDQSLDVSLTIHQYITDSKDWKIISYKRFSAH